MSMSKELKAKLDEYVRQGKQAKALGFENRREWVDTIRAAALGDVEAANRLDGCFPEWRDLLGPSTVTGSGG